MNWDKVDWQALARLRALFITGTAGGEDYWRKESDLESYDLTFAQRIGWKWDYVLTDLARLGWAPPVGEALDWGCGSGIAGRSFLDRFPTTTAMAVWDRSEMAGRFATRRIAERFPNVRVRCGLSPSPTLLLSHVLTELNDRQVEQLLSIASQATTIVWVEPGTFEASRRLIAIRERLRPSFNVVAPCTHCETCGLLAEKNARHWCHFLASSPPAVFTDGQWAKFARLAGIDLRRLPVSYLVLDKRLAMSLPAGATRAIGPPRLFKGQALLLGCDATGVTECRLTKSKLAADFSKLRKGEFDCLQCWRRAGSEIITVEALGGRK